MGSGSCRAFVPADGAGNGVTTDEFYSTADRRRPPVLLPLYSVAAERSGGRNDRTRVQRPPPSAMWPAVLDGGRPRVRRPPDSYPLVRPSCDAGARRRQYDWIQRPGHRQVADKMEELRWRRSRRDSSGEQLCEGRQNHARCGKAQLACVFMVGGQRLLTYLPGRRFTLNGSGGISQSPLLKSRSHFAGSALSSKDTCALQTPVPGSGHVPALKN